MWNDLSMQQRADVISMAVKAGMRDLDSIRSFYDSSVNKFAMGGPEETIVTPSDNTRVNYSPFVYVGDSQEVQDALNRRIAAEGKAAYATARFLPYIKYVTDVVDWTSGDPTDALQMAGDAVQVAGKGVANTFKGKNIGDKVMVGHRNHRRATKLTQAMIDDTKAFGKVVNKAGKITALPGFVGDIVQSYNDYKNWIEEEQNYNDVSSRIFNERVKTHPTVKIKSIGGPLFNNEFAKGGKIHIKPENRGKFTALKKRTGHSASWFKAHGTPAQKKMATFALNAKRWKHGDGGPLVEFATRYI